MTAVRITSAATEFFFGAEVDAIAANSMFYKMQAVCWTGVVREESLL